MVSLATTSLCGLGAFALVASKTDAVTSIAFGIICLRVIGRGDSPNEDETPLKQNDGPKKQSLKSFLPHFKKALEDARNQSNIAITTNTAPAVTVLEEAVETTQSVSEEQAQSSATSIPCPDTNDDSHVKVLQPAVGKISDETASIGPHSRSVSLSTTNSSSENSSCDGTSPSTVADISSNESVCSSTDLDGNDPIKVDSDCQSPATANPPTADLALSDSSHKHSLEPKQLVNAVEVFSSVGTGPFVRNTPHKYNLKPSDLVDAVEIFSSSVGTGSSSNDISTEDQSHNEETHLASELETLEDVQPVDDPLTLARKPKTKATKNKKMNPRRLRQAQRLAQAGASYTVA